MIEPYIGEIAQSMGTFPDVWVAILRASDAVEPIQSLLRVIAFVHGIDLWIAIGNYNDYAKSILDETSWIYDGKDAIIVAAPHDSGLAVALRNHSKVPTLWTTAPEKATDFLARAKEWFSFIYRTRKVLVLDLDGTIWDGVIGEGAEWLKQNWDLQREALRLYHKGIILAISSKNDEGTVLPFLDTGTILRPKHFAAWRINWADKTTNLREIAEELNVGLDSLVFFDNNPRERSWVRSQLPEVAVPELPEDLWKYATVLQNCLYFEGIGQTEEDTKRGQYYAEQRQRNEAKSTMTLEDFYWSLEQKVKIRPMTEETMPRVVQLLQKTNQFNLTTKRYSAEQIAEMDADPGWEIYTLRATDKFGDSGIVGVAILHLDNHNYCCIIDSFLLSCRAIGRAIETAFLSWIASRAKRQWAILTGKYLPTNKNVPAKDFYNSHGFTRRGDWWWHFSLLTEIKSPPWITYE
jgi:FkbH-like protein